MKENKTFPRVRELLQAEIQKAKSVNQIVKKTGLNHNTIGSYLEGRSEPTQHSLELISAAYHLPVAWLRGDSDDKGYSPNPSAEYFDVSTLPAESRALLDFLKTAPPQKVKKWLALVNMLEKDE